MTRPLEMKINLSALEHLGINLYSTVPAVLSEIVANAGDADATLVDVEINDLVSSHPDPIVLDSYLILLIIDFYINPSCVSVPCICHYFR